jgi:hypothetical protein
LKTNPEYHSLNTGKIKEIPLTLKLKIEGEVKALLHAHRDTLRNRRDTRETRFDCSDGYYGEAFGIMRGLAIMGYGFFGSVNLDGVADSYDGLASQKEHNLRWWFSQLEEEVLEEEGFYTDGRCEYCLENYKKDDRSLYGSLSRHQRTKHLNMRWSGITKRMFDCGRRNLR